MACAAAEDEDVDTLGLKADVSSPMHLVLASDASEHPKLFLMCGNTLGGFDPLDQTPHLTQILREGDRLIVDAENRMARRRSNPATIRWDGHSRSDR